jgi:hypothetical protein
VSEGVTAALREETMTTYEIFYDDGRGTTKVLHYTSQQIYWKDAVIEFEKTHYGCRVLEVR